VVVAVGGAGVDAGRLDLHGDGRPLRVFFVQVHRAGETLKLAAHFADHHVPHGKLNMGVNRVNLPGHEASSIQVCRVSSS